MRQVEKRLCIRNVSHFFQLLNSKIRIATQSKDYETVSKKTLETFESFLHHEDVDLAALELTELLELEFFLHSEGKTEMSALEAKMADYIYDELIERKLTDEEILICACFLSTLDNNKSKFEDARLAEVKAEKIKDIQMDFCLESEPYLPIIK